MKTDYWFYCSIFLFIILVLVSAIAIFYNSQIQDLSDKIDSLAEKKAFNLCDLKLGIWYTLPSAYADGLNYSKNYKKSLVTNLSDYCRRVNTPTENG